MAEHLRVAYEALDQAAKALANARELLKGYAAKPVPPPVPIASVLCNTCEGGTGDSMCNTCWLVAQIPAGHCRGCDVASYYEGGPRMCNDCAAKREQPAEPPRLSAECADEQPADLEDVEAAHAPNTLERVVANIDAGVYEQARTEALLPPAESVQWIVRLPAGELVSCSDVNAAGAAVRAVRLAYRGPATVARVTVRPLDAGEVAGAPFDVNAVTGVAVKVHASGGAR